MKKPTIEEEINQFLNAWGTQNLTSFLGEMAELFYLYDVDELDDWVKTFSQGDEEHVRNLRVIRTVYIVSRIAEFHAGSLCNLRMHFKGLWKRMEALNNGK